MPSSRLRSLLLADPNGAPVPWPVRLANLLLAFLVLAGVLALSFARLPYEWNWARVYSYRETLEHGWVVTLEIALASLAASTALGLALALARRSPLLVLRYLARGV